MIVDPGFIHHWKTKALGLAIGEAPGLIAQLSLWGCCQTIRDSKIEISNPRKLAGICSYTGDAEALLSHLLELQILDHLEGDVYEVHGWSEKNASLIQKWNAGKSPKTPRNPSAEDKPKPQRAASPEKPQAQKIPQPSPRPKELHVSPKVAEAVRKLFGRRETTAWDDREIKASKLISNNPEEELLQALQTMSEARSAGWTYHRKDTATLFNNWTSEVERAADFLAKPDTNSRSSETTTQAPKLSFKQIEEEARIKRRHGPSEIDTPLL